MPPPKKRKRSLSPATANAERLQQLRGTESQEQEEQLQTAEACVIENNQEWKIRLQQKRLNTAQPRANESCQDQEARLRQMRG